MTVGSKNGAVLSLPTSASAQTGYHFAPGLTKQQLEFVRQIKLQSARGGAPDVRTAALTAGYGEKSAGALGMRMMHNPRIISALQTMVLTPAEIGEIEIGPEQVIRDWFGIHATDVNEIVEHRRNACRWCHGAGFEYQRTPAEYRRDRAKFQTEYQEVVAYNTAHPNAAKRLPQFDQQGGSGFNPHKAPNPECPECHGDGESETFFKDTRYLSPNARRLYAGVKMTPSGGKEIKLRDQDQALQMIAKHFGMLINRSELGKPGEFDNLSREQLGALVVEKLTRLDIPKELAERFVSSVGVREDN